jgi:glycerol kinase
MMGQVATAPLVLAVDLGTTGVRALLVDATGKQRADAYRELLPSHPSPGLVEHDLEPIIDATVAVIATVMAGMPAHAVRAVGVTTQRSTAAVWDARTGRGVHAALSWQDGRTAARCTALQGEGFYVTPLMAATKIEWLLDRVDPDRRRVRAGELRCGTLDAWFLWRLSGGQVSATDPSNASTTGLYAPFEERHWDLRLLDALRIPIDAMPTIRDSSGVLGGLDSSLGLPRVPIAAVIGDQQAAMMGQLRTEPGETKITYGTAAMIDLNAGPTPLFSSQGAYPLALWQRDGQLTWCLEGTAITAGASVTWLRDGLGLIADPDETGPLAASVPDSGGVWVIPAFQGLGTPYMDTAARAVVGGLSRATTKAHIVRALLDGIAWRCREVYDALRTDCPHPAPTVLRVDGGAARNDVLLQAQADALGVPVERPAELQASALGAAYLAGLAVGVWSGTDELRAGWRAARRFDPQLDAGIREERFAAWRSHIGAARIVS